MGRQKAFKQKRSLLNRESAARRWKKIHVSEQNPEQNSSESQCSCEPLVLIPVGSNNDTQMPPEPRPTVDDGENSPVKKNQQVLNWFRLTILVLMFVTTLLHTA